MKLFEKIFGTKEEKVEGRRNMTSHEFRRTQIPLSTIEHRKGRRYNEMTSRARRGSSSKEVFDR